MTKDSLILKPDGAQETGTIELPDDFFEVPPAPEEGGATVWDEMAAALSEGVNSLDK